jgi:hypothetical protein
MKQYIVILASMMFFVFQGTTSAQMPQREGFSAIGWNGEYFLIGTFDGSLVKFDGSRFVSVAKLNSSITEIVNFSGGWVVGGEDFLVRYDGESFSEVLTGAGARIVTCNAGECLIYTGAKKLFSYDGLLLTDLTPDMKRELPGEYIVAEIIWDGREWLVLAKEAASWGKGRILRYADGRLSRVELPIYAANIASNGSTWLIIEAQKGEPYNLWLYDGELRRVEVPYEKFAVEQPPVNLFIDGVTWVKDSWVICASYGEHRRTLRFDEKTVALLEEKCVEREARLKELLPADEELLAAGSRNGEVLIASKAPGKPLVFYRYQEGRLDRLPSPPVELLRVDSIAYGEDYWLIGATSKPGVPPPPGAYQGETRVKPPMPVLLKFKGNVWEEVPLPGEGVTPSTFNVVPAWNGDYWLITLYDPNASPVFYRFDGVRFTLVNVTTDLLSIPQPPRTGFFPVRAAWDSDYWLMDTNRFLARYDGGFEVMEYAKGIYSPYRIRDMKYNGRYWLLLYVLAGTEGSALIKYDGLKFELLPYKPPVFATRQWPPIGDGEWGSRYWLIGTYRYVHPGMPEKVQEYMKPSLIKYDGENFEDVSDEFEKAVERKSVCGPTALLLLLLPVLYFRLK